MNPKWKLGALFLLLALITLCPASAKRNGAAQKAEPDYKNNNCVNCHSRLLEPLRVGNRYLEWQLSRHREKGASCEKCHGGAERDWRQEPLTTLTEHIIYTHHSFTRQELDRLGKLFDNVCSRHGENHPELFEAQKTFYQLTQDLIPHMLKEEQVLFPYITRVEEAAGEGRRVPPPFFGTVQNPVRMMMLEHEAAGDLLRALRATTVNYTPPPDACASYQALYQALAGFEADLHQHIHLENNLLFPRAIEMEEKAAPELRCSAEPPGNHRCFGH